jgi:hypothetical protein
VIPAGGGVEDVEAIRRLGGVNGQVIDEFMTTGAVVAGRGTFEPAGGWGGDHHDGVPIFILTRRNPAELEQWPLVAYVNDVATAMTRAKEAAGQQNVLVHGAGTAQLALAAGVLDEIELQLSRCSSAKGADCSRASLPNGASCSAHESSRAKAASLTCTTASSADVGFQAFVRKTGACTRFPTPS